MGGKNKKTTVGYKYHLGLHAVICQSPIDAFLQLDFADRTAWAGRAMGERIAVFANELFGGKSREGGVSGYIDVEDGAADQAVNSYLDAQLEPGLTPAFRGVVGLVFRQFYFGNNPYIKPWRAKVQNVRSTFQDWQPAIAAVNPEGGYQRTAIYIALDNSQSMATGTRLATMKAAVKTFLGTLPTEDKLAVRIVSYGGTVDGSIEFFGWDASALAEAEAFVDAFDASNLGTDFDLALASAGTFFTSADSQIPVDNETPNEINSAATSSGSSTGANESGSDSLRRVVLFVTDGEPYRTGASGEEQTIVDDAVATLAAISPAPEVQCFNIVLTDTQWVNQLDSDGSAAVIADGSSDEMSSALQSNFSSFCDLNAVHILRDLLIAPTSDGSGNADDIGTSFATAAQTAYSEGFGLSYLWQNTADKAAFKGEVERTLNCATDFDPMTGKWEIKLIRPDYDVETLFTFDKTVIQEWTEAPERAISQELTNQVTLEYTRRDNGKQASVTLPNIAGIIASGRIIPEKITMKGITWPALANKVCQRELEARSRALYKGAFRAAYIPSDIRRGSAVIVNEPRLGLESLVCRVTEIERGDGKDNSVIVRFAEDVWSVDPANDAIGAAEEGTALDYTALPPNETFFEELPFWTLIQLFGETTINDELAADPDLGYWGGTCDQPNALHIQATLSALDGSFYLEVEKTPFAPAWVLTSFLDRTPDSLTFTAAETGREGEIAVGDLMQIGTEFVRVDSVSIAGGVATFTVGRGCLDTVPKAHGQGSYALLWEDYFGSDDVQYTAGETVTAKILTNTARQQLSLASATAETVTFASRAYSPYPAADLMVESSYSPGLLSGTVTATWVHRDRTQQTTGSIEDFADASIGPETGVEYFGVMNVHETWADVFESGLDDFFSRADFFVDDTPAHSIEYTISPAQATSFDFDLDAAEPYFTDATIAIELGVRTDRGSPAYSNWQTPTVRVDPLLAPINLTATEV